MKIGENALIVLEPEGDIEYEQLGEWKVEHVPDGEVMGKCPKCQAEVKSEGTGYKCQKCKFRLGKKLLLRDLPPEDVRKMLSGPDQATSLIEGFISRRGRPFKAQLLFDEAGALQWKFPPRAAKKKASKKKTTKKKTTKKKVAAKKKTTKKKVATKKKVTKKATTKKATKKKATKKTPKKEDE